jgi:outer membrane protein insertion porin family
MSKRWVKLSRGVLLGTLMIMGSAQAEEPRDAVMVPAVVEAVIDETAQQIPVQVAEAEQPTATEQVERETTEAVDIMLPERDEELAQQRAGSEDEPSAEQKAEPQEEGTAQVEPPKTEGAEAKSEDAEAEESESEQPPTENTAPVEDEDVDSDQPEKTDSEPAGDEQPTQPSRDPVGPPPIVNIEVEGNASVPTNAILEVVSTRIGDPLLEPRLRRDLQAIFDLGYFTDVRFATPPAPGGIRLVFRVLENPVVNSVEFKGNEVVEGAVLRGVMDTESGQILNTRTIHNDIQAINQYYNEELGYLRTPTHVTDVAFEDGRLVLTIADGIVVSGVDVTGVTVFPEEKVANLIRIKPGELFNRKTLEEDLTAINDLYEKDQWVLDTVDPKIDPDTGQVTVTVVEAVVEEIRVEGNSKTRTATVLRNLRTKPGTVLNRRRFQKDLERLNNLGYFRKVEPDPQRGSEPGQVILVLDVQEEKTGLATIGVGYAGGGSSGIRSGVTGAISYSDRNLFGQGKNVSVSWQRGAQISSIGVSYLDPAINGNQDSIGVSLFKNDVDGLRQPIIVDGQQEFAFYDDSRIGGSVTYGHPLNDDLRIFGTLRHETIEILRDSQSLFEPIGLGTGVLNSVGLSALYDTRDDIFNPHVGSFANAAINVAGLGGDFSFTKYTVEGRHYVPLGEKHTLAMRAWGGLVTGDAPITEFFFAGGPDTLRGYQQNQFFGTRFFVANLEYRFPIANIKFLRGAVFADAGTAFSPGDNINNKLFYDAGLGLRITFPALGLGVIRLDYAWGEDGGRTQIGIGQSF